MKYLKLYESFQSSHNNFYANYIDKFVTSGYKILNNGFRGEYDEDNFNEVIETLNKDCSKFIKELIDKKQYPIFRGARYADESYIPGLHRKSSYDKRNNVDTNSDFSEILDNEFEKKFGYRFRSENAVFACKNPSIALDYGSAFIFFPIGDYKYTWNPEFEDLYGHLERKDWYDDFINLDYNYETFYKKPLYNEIQIGGHWLIDDKKYNSVNSMLVDFPNLTSGQVSNNWIPNHTQEEYYEINYKKAREEAEKIVSGYKLGGLEQVLTQELIFTCKEYYLVDVSYYKILMENLGLKSNI